MADVHNKKQRSYNMSVQVEQVDANQAAHGDRRLARRDRSATLRGAAAGRHRQADGSLVGRRRDRLRADDGPRLVGPVAIRAAFERMFGNAAIDVRPERVRRLLTHASAVHSVLERVRLPTPEGPRTAWVIATNVYIRSAQGWRLAAHHASPGAPDELREIAEAPSVLH